MKQNPVRLRQQQGSLLIQLAITLAVLALLTAANADDLARKMNQVLTEGTAQEIHLISEAAANFYDQNGQWPDQGGHCVNALTELQSAGLLSSGMDLESPFYNSATNPSGRYVFSCAANQFNVTVNTKTGWGTKLLSYLGGATIAGNTVTQSTPIPGSYPALNALLPRDGSRPMIGNLDINSNEVNNVDRLDWGTGSELKSDEGGVMELGDSLSGTASPYIDFHFGKGAAEDYNVRIANDADGQLSLIANKVRITGDASAQDFWSTTKNRSLMQAIQDATVVGPDQYVLKPSCGTLTPQIFAVPAAYAPSAIGEPIQAVQTWAISEPTRWKIKFRLLTESGWVTPSSTYAKIIALSKCM